MTDMLNLKVMIEQLATGDMSVYETTKEILNADMSEEETKEVMKMFTKVYNDIELVTIADLQMSLALYSLGRSKQLEKFFKWVSDRLDKVMSEEWTIKDFIKRWEKAYNGIHDKLSDDSLDHLDKLAIANIINMVNDIKKKVRSKIC